MNGHHAERTARTACEREILNGEKLKEAKDACGGGKQLPSSKNGRLEAAHELQYYRAMEKERRKWEAREKGSYLGWRPHLHLD